MLPFVNEIINGIRNLKNQKAMKRKLCFVLLCGLLSLSAWSQKNEVYPRPRSLQYGEGTLALTAMPEISGDVEALGLAVDCLRSFLPDTVASGKAVRLIVGKQGDKAVRKYAKRIPPHAEGYYLKVEGEQIVIAGKDERGVLYGVRTLGQLLRDGRLPAVEITDWPEIAYRGVVEGFYGTPWSTEARASVIRFLGEYKMNTYVYGPKDDPYHRSPNWREPYPEEEAAELRRLVEVAEESGVDFVWAIHPGQDIRWTDEDRDNLLRKFEQMYDLGVRAFAVFFDDISGEGTNAERQAELLNYIDERFVQAKPDVAPLLMCPTDYAKAWAQNGSYIGKMGELLNPSINVMFTGDAVIASITRECVEWVDEKIRRPVYIWWNYPVTDYIRNRLLMGPVYGNDTTLTGEDMRGFVSNPMEYAEASKVAIYGVGGYAWNPAAYDALEAWRESMAVLMPEDADALLCFASHNADPGGEGWHQWRREESVDIAPVAGRYARAWEKGAEVSAEDEARLVAGFEAMVASADRLLVNEENPALVKELTPWLRQFKLQGETGREVMALARDARNADWEAFDARYRHVRALQKQSFILDQTLNQNEFQPGVVVGTRVLQPFINSVFTSVVKAANARWGTSLEIMAEYSPHRLTTTVEQLEGLPVQVKGGNVQLPPSLEVIRWASGAYVQVEFTEPLPVVEIQVNTGQRIVEAWQLEVRDADGTWRTLPVAWKDREMRVAVDAPVSAIRWTNTSLDTQDIFLRKFLVLMRQ